VAAIVRSAEAYNGRGYPRAQQGEAIPLASRIVAVADAFDAMTRPKIYRDPMPSSEALREILRCSESQFDPVVVSALLKVLGEADLRC
jgi:HD-GYP domain-containing protein (c-di-GMP phosphodiesterase class II)